MDANASEVRSHARNVLSISTMSAGGARVLYAPYKKRHRATRSIHCPRGVGHGISLPHTQREVISGDTPFVLQLDGPKLP